MFDMNSRHELVLSSDINYTIEKKALDMIIIFNIRTLDIKDEKD